LCASHSTTSSGQKNSTGNVGKWIGGNVKQKTSAGFILIRSAVIFGVYIVWVVPTLQVGTCLKELCSSHVVFGPRVIVKRRKEPIDKPADHTANSTTKLSYRVVGVGVKDALSGAEL
jgi:hypothetical protein